MKQDVFHVLPHDLIGEVLSHLNSVELIFTFSHVSHHWRRICYELIWDQNKGNILKFAPNTFQTSSSGKSHHQLEEKNLEKFLHSNEGRKFTKYLLRKQVYEFSCQLQKIGQQSVDGRSVIYNEKWVDEELKALKGYFSIFQDLNDLPKHPLTVKPKQVDQQSKGFFSSTLSYIGSFFSKNSSSASSSSSTNSTNSSSNNNTTPTTVVSPPTPVKPSDFDYLTKILLDGDSGSGKSSLLNCAMNDLVVDPHSQHYIPTIGVDFAIKLFKFGETTRVKIQLWDHASPERYHRLATSYYRGASVILLLLDPYRYTDFSKNILKSKLDDIREYAPKAEVIFITTKKDKTEQRLYSNEQADQYAYESFGGIHLDITSTKLEEPKNIVLYCSLLKYLLSP